MTEEVAIRDIEAAAEKVKKENGTEGPTLGKRPLSPRAQEGGKEGSSGDDSEATVNSTDDENSPNFQKTGVRRKRAKLNKESPEEDAGEGRDGEEPLPNAGKHRRKRTQPSSKAAEKGEKRDGLLRLAQIANASPRIPKKQRGDKEVEGEFMGGEQNMPAQTVMEAPPPIMVEPQTVPAMGQGEAVQGTQGPEDFEQKITPAQLRAWVASGQPLNLPGFLPHLLPHVQMGARWQLDLRTGERLEEQGPPNISLAMQVPGQQQGMMGANLMHGSALAQAMGARPPIFTGPNQQIPGSYGGVAPANYSGALPIPALGLLPGDSGSPAGPYTALLGSQMQMQNLMPPGVMHGQYHQAFGPGSELELAQQQLQLQQQQQLQLQQQQQQQQQTVSEGKKRRSGAASSNASGDGLDMQDIPLRRRGRPAGDGSTPLASPKELQDRRMQANRAAASRSHFRRKREMEVLEKECSVVELRVIDLRMTLQSLLAQEEQLRMQQGAIRDHLAAGCNPNQPLPIAAPPVQGLLPHPALQGEHQHGAEHHAEVDPVAHNHATHAHHPDAIAHGGHHVHQEAVPVHGGEEHAGQPVQG